jgi:histidine ammonia-lyase
MSNNLELGAHPLRIEDVVSVARDGAQIAIGEPARTRIVKGRDRLEELIVRGERIYGVNTGVGGNIGISLAPEQMETMQHNLVRHLAPDNRCLATWSEPLPCCAWRRF